MGIVDTIRDLLVPDTEPGVHLQCTSCGAEFDAPREHCPECGSTDVKEVEGFDMAPDT
ncbi:hydrogenase maturation nickel metallochaperone HypA [Halosimplex salinum]|uniref:hydrogenase maturation nickel metallochaperone HypA n=1 Tax=Halosimplex salinum TaxID=1710538 RepID=UPI0013DE521C|nr:hydrogenase maturation nickel metallochaperone HypA [Halosimplex salinum]